MAMQYFVGEKAHSFMFGSKDSYDDFYLIPDGKQYIANPTIVTNYVTVPGASGQLDLSEILTGSPVFGNREGSLEFYIENDRTYFDIIKSRVANYLHGKAMKVIDSDNRMYYYYGRLALNEDSSDINHSKITIDYYLDPFKYLMWSNDEKWLWDPFDFEMGVINDWTGVTINGQNTITFDWGPMEIVPVITVNSSNGKPMKIQLTRVYVDNFGEEKTETYNEIEFPAGTNKSPQLVLKEGRCTLLITGYGTLKIGAREASL